MRWERHRRRSASLSRGTRRPWMWVAKLAPKFGTTCSKNSPRANSWPRISQDPRTLASLSGLFANPFPFRTISEKVLAYLIHRIFYFLLSIGYSDILIRVFKKVFGNDDARIVSFIRTFRLIESIIVDRHRTRTKWGKFLRRSCLCRFSSDAANWSEGNRGEHFEKIFHFPVESRPFCE